MNFITNTMGKQTTKNHFWLILVFILALGNSVFVDYEIHNHVLAH